MRHKKKHNRGGQQNHSASEELSAQTGFEQNSDPGSKEAESLQTAFGMDSTDETRQPETNQAVFEELQTVVEKMAEQNEQKEDISQGLAGVILGEENPAELSVEEQKPEQPIEQVKEELDRVLEPEAAVSAPEQEESSQNAPLASVSYESVAKAAEDLKKEPNEHFSRDAVDEGEFLKEICTLIGDGTKVYQPKKEGAGEEAQTEKSAESLRPVPRITVEDLHEIPDTPEDVLEDDSTGVSGWVKGLFLLVISLLLSGMTLYAVFSELMGKTF